MTPVETKNTSSSRPASNRRSARRRRRWPYACALAGVGLWLAWCALTIVRAHDDVQAGRQSARELQHVGYGHLVDGDGRESVEQARDSFADAAGRLEQPGLLPLRILPVIGRQLDSTTSLSRAAVDGLDAGIEALDRLDVALGESLPAGPERPAALREVSIIAGDLGRELRTLDLGPEDGLIGRLAAARDEFAFDVDELATSSERAEVATSGLADVFDGPGRWLLLAANNAQMQNGSGMFLSYSVMHVADGDIVMDAVERTELLRPSHKVELDPDQASTWPWMDPNADFRHLGTSSRFDATAEEAAALFAAAGGGEVDGVLAVDAFAVRSLLEITGPIEVDGDAVGADDVVQELLHDQYVVFAETGATDRAQSARRDRLGEVASGALDALANASEIDVEDYDVLAAAAGGRHLMMWSPDSSYETTFEAAGVDGEIAEGGVLLSVVNCAIKEGAELPPKPIILTFDDGGETVFSNALPILQKYGFTGSAYIVYNYIGVPAYMNADQIRALYAAGWEIGSHSISHVDLTLRSDRQMDEIVDSRTKLQTLLGVPILTFAYPFGAYDKDSLHYVHFAGYIAAMGLANDTLQGNKNLFYLYRMSVNGNQNLEAFALLLPWRGDLTNLTALTLVP